MVRIYNSKKLKLSARSSKLGLGLLVQVMVGKNKGFKGKITKLHRSSSRVEISGLTSKNSKFKDYNLKIHTSNLMRYG